MVGAASPDPQPHPLPPVDFSSASRTQQALAAFGAGPPQQLSGVSSLGVVDALRVIASWEVVCASLVLDILGFSVNGGEWIFVLPLMKTP